MKFESFLISTFVVSFTPGKRNSYTLIRRLSGLGPHSQNECCDKERNPYAEREYNSRRAVSAFSDLLRLMGDLKQLQVM